MRGWWVGGMRVREGIGKGGERDGSKTEGEDFLGH